MESGRRKLLKNPRQSANFLSVLCFIWSIPIFRKSYYKVLQAEDVYEPLDVDRSKTAGDRLERQWRKELKGDRRPSLMRALFKAFWPEVSLIGFLVFFTYIIARMALSIVLGQFLIYFQKNSEMSKYEASTCAVAIIVLIMCYGMGCLHYNFCGQYFAMRIRVALSSLIYQKALRLSQNALSETAPGKLVNLISNDLQRIEDLYVLHGLWVSPLATIVTVYISWTEIRWAGVIGVAIILLVIPIQSYVGKMSAKIRFETALQTDQRVRFMDEIISGAQLIKLYAWEKPFAKLIAATRRLELKMILKNGYVQSFYLTITLFSTKLVVFCTILSFILLYGSENITVSKLFVATFLFNNVSLLMTRLFVRGVSEMGHALIAVRRLQMFLEYQEKYETPNINSDPNGPDLEDVSVLMKDVSAAWTECDEQRGSPNTESKVDAYKRTARKDALNSKEKDQHSFRLQDINLEVPKGKLIFVVGSVGAGKSSLLQVLLKELPLASGSMAINGSISYASQESWIFTSTIRQNITFGQPMDRSRYDEVIKSTALDKDLTQFSDGDMTFVGEHGAGLSGGQKARINLARAVYRKADIYLIDDPLSAIDTHVQSHLFSKCLGRNGYLAQQNATRILVTHQLHFLKEADWIVALKEGKIEAQGSYETIIANCPDLFMHEYPEDRKILKKDWASLEDGFPTLSLKTRFDPSKSENVDKESSFQSENQNKSSEETGLVKELESSSKEKVKGSLLWNYFKYANQPCTLTFLAAGILLTQILESSADVWVSYWIHNEESRQHYILSDAAIPAASSNDTTGGTGSNAQPTEIYIYVYTIIMLSLFVIAAARSVVFFKFCKNVSQNLHCKMFDRLISTSMRFFDENPVGRITNRFTKDLGAVDEQFPKILMGALKTNLNSAGIIIVAICTDFKLSIVVFVMVVFGVVLKRLYLKCSTNIKLLEGSTKSPVFTHISATLTGLSTVRAFQAENILREEFESLQDLNSGSYFMFLGVMAGFGMALDLIAYAFTGCVLYFSLVLNEGATGNLVGLALTQTLELAVFLQYGLRLRKCAEVSNQLMSVGRVMEYCQLEPEKQPDIPEKVALDWPSKGKVEFKDVSYRYSEDGEPVLRGLTFSVEPKEKVSVVGRTGAGKSSLISSIFRLAYVDGDILLDGVNTSRVNLNVLRSRVSIIPQEPILFSGTLRRNLDPFEEYSDDDIWRALENVELKDYVLKSNGLQMAVLARGQNFSVGQRQILCLARAMLRRNKIIILDEATANVDLQTDAMIQRTIREKFADCTVITVAHRLNTVIDSDRVLVMDTGVAVEYDAPLTLLQNGNGVFRKMAEALGPQEYDRLYSIAEEEYEKNLKKFMK